MAKETKERRWRPLHVIVTFLALVTVVGGILVISSGRRGRDPAGGGSQSSSTTSAARPSVAEAVQGGHLTFGAEREPGCMDWVGSCAGASWGIYTVQALTMPRSFDIDDNTYKPSSLLAGEPRLVTTPKQVVTYRINDSAVWNDGTPITSEDYRYTWDQVVNGTDIYSRSGYEKIESVATEDHKTAVVTFSEPFGAWRDLFGGYYGILPSHILKNQDRHAMMTDGYKFSGGPWVLEAWDKGIGTKLVPNPTYWGTRPNLGSITFKLVVDAEQAQRELRSGQLSMLYPQPQPGQDRLKSIPGIRFQAGTSLSYEAIWLNTTRAPFTSTSVRQALAHALDRDAIVKQLFAPIQPDIKRIDSFATPAFGEQLFDSFSRYAPVNPGKVTDLMQTDGWTKGADGIWARGGQRASFEVKSTLGNLRRQRMLEIMQSQLRLLGFEMSINLIESSVLFGEDGPRGSFQAALYAQVPQSADPGQCDLWCSKNIPGPANGASGQNWTRVSDPAVDEPYLAMEKELDDTKITDLARRGQEALAEAVPAIPIDPVPDVIAYQENVIGGTVRHNPAFGPWVYANTWFLKER